MNSIEIQQAPTTTAPTAPRALVAAPASAGNRVQQILNDKIAKGQASAARTMQAIMTQHPKDQIVRLAAARFTFDDDKGLQVGVAGDEYKPSSHALGQIANRAGIPTAYLRRLLGERVDVGADEATGVADDDRDEDGWRPDLAVHLLKTHYAHHSGRGLVRSVNGQLRGWLSDHYRRIDSRPLIEALAEEAQALNAIPIDGTATETRYALKVVLPYVIEPVAGEYMLYGLEWSNSDYGNGLHSVASFAIRVVCTNGMTRENMLKQVHLGGRINEEIAFSTRTYELDTQANTSAMRDIARGALGPAAIDSMTAKIQAANAKAYSADRLKGAVARAPKKVAEAIVEAYKGEDVVNLPAGDTAWRASNAISWIARSETTSPELRLDLERLAGSLV